MTTRRQSGPLTCRAAARMAAALLVATLRASAAVAQEASAAAEAVVPESLRDFVPVTDEMLLQPRPENCISFRNGYDLWGYSPLDQIDAANVGELRLVWSRAMREGYQEIEPIVYNGVMFLSHVEDMVEAVDAATGDLLWETILNGPVGGRPMTYRVGGRQYLAIGSGGLSMGIYFLPLTPELSTPTGSNTLFVFALPES